MSEVMTPPLVYADENGDPIYGFGEQHSWGDVVRWIMQNPSDGETVLHLLQEALDNLPSGLKVIQ
jgi:hypothetical protein